MPFLLTTKKWPALRRTTKSGHSLRRSADPRIMPRARIPGRHPPVRNRFLCSFSDPGGPMLLHNDVFACRVQNRVAATTLTYRSANVSERTSAGFFQRSALKRDADQNFGL